MKIEDAQQVKVGQYYTLCCELDLTLVTEANIAWVRESLADGDDGIDVFDTREAALEYLKGEK